MCIWSDIVSNLCYQTEHTQQDFSIIMNIYESELFLRDLHEITWNRTKTSLRAQHRHRKTFAPYCKEVYESVLLHRCTWVSACFIFDLLMSVICCRAAGELMGSIKRESTNSSINITLQLKCNLLVDSVCSRDRTDRNIFTEANQVKFFLQDKTQHLLESTWKLTFEASRFDLRS